MLMRKVLCVNPFFLADSALERQLMTPYPPPPLDQAALERRWGEAALEGDEHLEEP